MGAMGQREREGTREKGYEESAGYGKARTHGKARESAGYAGYVGFAGKGERRGREEKKKKKNSRDMGAMTSNMTSNRHDRRPPRSGFLQLPSRNSPAPLPRVEHVEPSEQVPLAHAFSHAFGLRTSSPILIKESHVALPHVRPCSTRKYSRSYFRTICENKHLFPAFQTTQ